MKSWADHCSSDEESDDIPRVSSLGNLQAYDDHDSDSDHSDEEPAEEEVVPVYNFPSSPPYTAFVGNLPFDIQDANHLAFELETMCEGILNRKVTAINGRLMMDQHTGKKKGFGYVEFQTLEDLKTVLELNNKAELSGRKIRLDVANAPKNPRPNNQNRSRPARNNHDHSANQHHNNNNHHHSNAIPEIDGSQFQKGRFQRSASHSSTSTQSSNNHAKLRRYNSNGSSELPSSSSNMPKSRPMLKLAPRSKPLEPATSNPSKSQSSIFGGAKPREEPVLTNEGNKNSGNGTQPTPTAILKPVRKQAPNTDTVPVTNNSTVESITTNTSNATTIKKDGPSPSSSNNHSSSFRRGKDGKDRNNRRGSAKAGRGKKKQEDRRGSNTAINKRGGSNNSSRKLNDGWDETQSKPNKSAVDVQKKNKAVEEPKPKPVKHVNAFAALGLDDSDSD